MDSGCLPVGELSWKKISVDLLSVGLMERGSDKSTIGPLEVYADILNLSHSTLSVECCFLFNRSKNTYFPGRPDRSLTYEGSRSTNPKDVL